jgi:dTDP-4-dehydrorhamnose reductase
MCRWMITGAAGMFGRELADVLAMDPSAEVTTLARADLDITDAEACVRTVAGHDIVVNAVGYTQVDRAEQEEAAATAVNGGGARNLADACAVHGAVMVHVSTDYVFSGEASQPYAEDDPQAPINAYGRSKLVGEEAVLRRLPRSGYVVRTAWLYGEHGPNFVATMLRLASESETVDVVDDEYGQPTWAYALAQQVTMLGRAALAGQAPPGVYHCTASGQATWYELASAVFELSGLDAGRIRPTATERFPRPARRPSYSVLGHGRWIAAGLPAADHWRVQLADALARPGFRALEPLSSGGDPSLRRGATE